MTLFSVLPAGAELSCPCGLFVFGALDALGHRCWCLAVPWGALPSLGIGGCGQHGQNQEEGNLSEANFQVERNSGELKSMGLVER